MEELNHTYHYPDDDYDVMYLAPVEGILGLLHVVVGIAAVGMNIVGLWRLHRHSKGDWQFHLILKMMGWLGLIALLAKMIFVVFPATGFAGKSYFMYFHQQLFPFLFPWVIPIWDLVETVFYFMAALLCYERKRSCNIDQAGKPIKWALIMIPIVAIGLIQAVPTCFLYRTFPSERLSYRGRTGYEVRLTELATSYTYHLIETLVLRPLVLLVPFILTIHQLYGLSKTKPLLMTEEDVATSVPINFEKNGENAEEPVLDRSSSILSQNVRRAVGLRTAVLFISALGVQILQQLLQTFFLSVYSPYSFIYKIFTMLNTAHLGSSLVFYIIMEKK